jgi:hypothetical protein
MLRGDRKFQPRQLWSSDTETPRQSSSGQEIINAAERRRHTTSKGI